ncbi:G-protein alpha subunit [Phanerochaete sordida]|uniref:G-protein alpha subunit n=1 Tax=Phanerochaete sordida TaxID=48140 RepID=A0A9P3LCW4_9APHY|nr:G-protein alpha subunit [Phanerochaete sordida]
MASLARRPFHANHAPYEDRQDDPLAKVLQPPPDESPEQRARREQEANEAHRVSLQIDEGIQEDRKAYERRKKAVKVLLLGQAESGKSTTLKNFQLAFTPAHFRNERLAWRTIIQLNLIRSLKTLLEVMQEEMAHPTEAPPPPPVLSEKARGKLPMGAPVPLSVVNGVGPAGKPPPAATRSVRFSTQPASQAPLTDVHRRARMRLLPLLKLESELTLQLFPELAAAIAQGQSLEGAVPANVSFTPALTATKEVTVRAGNGWKDVLGKLQKEKKGKQGQSLIDELSAVLDASKEDIVGMWEDRAVKDMLRRRGIRLQDMPGFFLNDAMRVSAAVYEPTDDDIVRARLRTLGVEEHRFTMESGASGSEWYIYDVGGNRGMRPHWIPYFDDVQAIIFLAPLAFNLMLEEDSKVNRLEDSITLWREICGNALLERATLILFFNKMDILQATLAAGIRVQKFVPSYGDQPNDVVHVVKYFREKFRGYHKRLSPQARPFYCHETSVIDTRATAVILVGVREGILRAHLQSVNVI